MAKNPRCEVKFARNKYGVVAQLWYRGERLDEASVDPGERELVKHQLLKRCKESVAAREKPGFDPGQFFRTLDTLNTIAQRRNLRRR